MKGTWIVVVFCMNHICSGHVEVSYPAAAQNGDVGVSNAVLRGSDANRRSSSNEGAENLHKKSSIEKRSSRSAYNWNEIQTIVDKHNAYRAGEGASNMLKMSWDDDLADMAQEWADRCVWEHGQPYRPYKPFEDIGQNLYYSSYNDVEVEVPIERWFNEKADYLFSTQQCRSVCGHYTQIVWAESHAVGCGWANCGGSMQTYVVCNYGPAGNYIGEDPYIKGEPCTQCESGVGWCRDGFCDGTCSHWDSSCVCQAECKNCGRKDPEQCTCECAAGWYGSDCSVPCQDTHEYCNNNGWPTYWCDADHPYVLYYCPESCGLCERAHPGDRPCNDNGGGSPASNSNEWSEWDTSQCPTCDLCGQKVRTRGRGNSQQTDTASCDPPVCQRDIDLKKKKRRFMTSFVDEPTGNRYEKPRDVV